LAKRSFDLQPIGYVARFLNIVEIAVGTAMHFKYLGYVAIIVAVLLDLYAGNPAGDATLRVIIDWLALFFAVAGLGGLAVGPVSSLRR
jgi:hypothetical protein